MYFVFLNFLFCVFFVVLKFLIYDVKFMYKNDNLDNYFFEI